MLSPPDLNRCEHSPSLNETIVCHLSHQYPTSTEEQQQAAIPSYPFPFAEHSLECPAMYDQLRATCPVARVHMPVGGDAYLLTRHADVVKAWTDPKCGVIRSSDGDVPRREANRPRGAEEGLVSIITMSDTRPVWLRRQRPLKYLRPLHSRFWMWLARDAVCRVWRNDSSRVSKEGEKKCRTHGTKKPCSIAAVSPKNCIPGNPPEKEGAGGFFASAFPLLPVFSALGLTCYGRCHIVGMKVHSK